MRSVLNILWIVVAVLASVSLVVSFALFTLFGEQTASFTAVSAGALLIVLAASFDAPSIPVLVLAAFFFPIIATLSFFLNGAMTGTFFGSGFEFGTVGFYALCAICALLGALLPRKLAAALVASACAVLIAAGFFAGWGNTLLLEYEAKPTWRASAIVAEPQIGFFSSSMIGAGPRSFPVVWNSNRSEDFNTGPFWDTVPDRANSAAMTMFVELGVLGVLAFFSIPLLAAHASILYGRSPDAFLLLLLVCTAFIGSSAYLWSAPVFFVAFLAFGVLSRLLFAPASPRAEVAWIGRASLVAVGLVLLGAGVPQLSAAWSAREGAQALADGHTEEALESYRRSASVWGDFSYELEVSRAAASIAVERTRSGGISDAAQVRAAFDEALVWADRAVDSAPKDLDTWLNVASIRVLLVESGVSAEIARAHSALNQAVLLAPTRPETFFVLARLNVAEGDAETALEDIHEALRLKPDYGPALEYRALLNAQ